MAVHLRRRKSYPEAEQLSKESIAILQLDPVNNKSKLGISISNLADIYFDQREFNQALPLYVESVSMVETALGQKHLSTANMREKLAKCYLAMGEFDKSNEQIDVALPIIESIKELRTLSRLLNMRIEIFLNQTNYVAAAEQFDKYLKLRSEIIKSQDPGLPDILDEYANVLSKLGRDSEASTLKSRAASLRSELTSTRSSKSSPS
jgi:tetratricopeptide (TPR) repeat protein